MNCLRDIRIYNSSRCILGAMILIFQTSPFIQRLSITGSDFNEGDLCCIVSFCPNLIEFNLDIPTLFKDLLGGDALASCMARQCTKIQYLALEGLQNMSDDGLLSIIRSLGPQLERLQLKSCSQVTEYGLARIADCLNLKKLTLSHIPALNDGILIGIVTFIYKKLEFMQLESVPISNCGIQYISNVARSLKQLRLYDLDLLTDISFLSHSESHGLSNLKLLMLHGSPALSNSKDIEKFGAPLLERLELVGCVSIDEKLLNNMILNFSKLKRLIYAGPHASLEFQKVYFNI